MKLSEARKIMKGNDFYSPWIPSNKFVPIIDLCVSKLVKGDKLFTDIKCSMHVPIDGNRTNYITKLNGVITEFSFSDSRLGITVRTNNSLATKFFNHYATVKVIVDENHRYYHIWERKIAVEDIAFFESIGLEISDKEDYNVVDYKYDVIVNEFTKRLVISKNDIAMLILSFKTEWAYVIESMFLESTSEHTRLLLEILEPVMVKHLHYNIESLTENETAIDELKTKLGKLSKKS